MLNNFGGRLGLHGHLDNLNTWLADAFKNSSKIAGIGITPEASFNNPVLYEFLFEYVWCESEEISEIDLSEWICDYIERRYGAVSESVKRAWAILLKTVYKAQLNNLGQGAPESIVNARPSLQSRSASSWGNAVISYDKNELVNAAELMLSEYELLKDSAGYKYDIITVLQQILSNTAQDIHSNMADAFNKKDLIKFQNMAKEFLDIIDLMDIVTSGNEYYLLGRWIAQARKLAQNTDDFTKKLYEINAKSIITTWGTFNQSETGGLHDYSNRQWSGLIDDFYKMRWEHWIKMRSKELEDEPFEDKINWFALEWNWVRENKNYSFEPEKIDLLSIARTIMSKARDTFK